MADREPMDALPRLDHMRPVSSPVDDHASHDRWLVVRAATDPADLTPDETVQARLLLRDCIECSTLATDLGVISHAMTTVPVPTRPRDFRVTPEQAAAARGSVLTRLGRWIAAPRQAVLRPVAGAALAMGIVLVAVSPMIPRDAAPTGRDGGGGGVGAPVATDAMGRVPAMMTPEPGGAEVATQSDTGPMETTAGSGRYAERYGVTGREAKESNDPRLAMDTHGGSPEPVDPNSVLLPPTTDSASQPPARPDGPDAAPMAAVATTTGMDDTSYALLLLGVVLAGSGGIILLLVWFGRRTEDPLLR